MENNGTVSERKCLRKQKRAQHRLARDMNIKCCDDPTENIVICNAGLVTGLQREILEQITNEIITGHKIIMPPGKSYCFIKCASKYDAQIFHSKIHGCTKSNGLNIPLYLSFAETVPDSGEDRLNADTFLPPGLVLIEEFITPEEESILLEAIDWNDTDNTLPELKHRKVKHYGYEFRYDTNKVDPNDPIEPIPKEYEFLQRLFEEHNCGTFIYDQLTINRYLPGQGIPPHIDTHSVFEDTILSLSLQSACVMDFKRGEQRVNLHLPPRSLLVMSGESRYAWSHGICPRRNDIIKANNGTTVRERGTRTSFTFRKVRTGNCLCCYDEYCDTKRDKRSCENIENSIATGLESSYVHEVYEKISNHFDETRQKQWPNVTKFIDSVETGGLLLDVGCGNGKYLVNRSDIFKIGCDRSSGLTGICRNRGFEVILCDCLALPFTSCSVDAVISIAVIHHLSTKDRRKQAIEEILRVLRVGGTCLIYVWAKDQHKDSIDSTYLKYKTHKSKESSVRNTETRAVTETGLALPVHENRTNFVHSDVLVPWKRKGGGDFLRFYHVFEENELAELCTGLSNATIENLYYDQGNWCTILRKK